MKRLILVAALSLSMLGCATTSSSGPQTNSMKSIDQKYVNAVEYQARRAGVRVEWVNPPRGNSDSSTRTNR